MSEAKKPVKKPVTKSPLKKSFAGSSNPKKPATRASRIFRGPLFWILVAILAVSLFGQITAAGTRPVDPKEDWPWLTDLIPFGQIVTLDR